MTPRPDLNGQLTFTDDGTRFGLTLLSPLALAADRLAWREGDQTL